MMGLLVVGVRCRFCGWLDGMGWVKDGRGVAGWSWRRSRRHGDVCLNWVCRKEYVFVMNNVVLGGGEICWGWKLH